MTDINTLKNSLKKYFKDSKNVDYSIDTKTFHFLYNLSLSSTGEDIINKLKQDSTSNITDIYNLFNTGIKEYTANHDSTISVTNPFIVDTSQLIYIDSDVVLKPGFSTALYKSLFYLYQLYYHLYSRPDNIPSRIILKDHDLSDVAIEQSYTNQPASPAHAFDFGESSDKENAVKFVGNHLRMLKDIEQSGSSNMKERLFVFLSLVKMSYVEFTAIAFKKLHESLPSDSADLPTVVEMYRKNYNCLENHVRFIEAIFNNLTDIGLNITYEEGCTFNVGTNNDFIKRIFQNISNKVNVVSDGDGNFYDIKVDTEIKDNKVYLTGCDQYKNKSGLKIIFRPKEDYEREYQEKLEDVRELNKILTNRMDEYETSKSDMGASSSRFKGITGMYYGALVLVIIVVLALFSGTTDSERSMITLMLLPTVVILYTLFIYSFDNIEMYSTASTIPDIDAQMDEYKIKILKLIHYNTPLIALDKVYNDLGDVIDRDIDKLHTNTNIVRSHTVNTENETTSQWHDSYRKGVMIHSIFMMIIIFLIFNWFNTNFPDESAMLIAFTSVAIIIVVFNYFRNIYKITRTNERTRYWTKMKI